MATVDITVLAGTLNRQVVVPGRTLWQTRIPGHLEALVLGYKYNGSLTPIIQPPSLSHSLTHSLTHIIIFIASIAIIVSCVMHHTTLASELRVVANIEYFLLFLWYP